MVVQKIKRLEFSMNYDHNIAEINKALKFEKTSKRNELKPKYLNLEYLIKLILTFLSGQCKVDTFHRCDNDA